MTAVIGLVGVVIGALATGGMAFLMERRRERRSIRAAARIVQQELVEGMTAAGQIYLFEDGAVVTRSIFIGKSSWLRHQYALAEALSDPEWDELVVASKNRDEFVSWLETRTVLHADDLTKLKVENFN